jgi:hypothetical protein
MTEFIAGLSGTGTLACAGFTIAWEISAQRAKPHSQEWLCYKTAILCLRGGAQPIHCNVQPRFVAVSRVLLEHAFADGAVNRG